VRKIVALKHTRIHTKQSREPCERRNKHLGDKIPSYSVNKYNDSLLDTYSCGGNSGKFAHVSKSTSISFSEKWRETSSQWGNERVTDLGWVTWTLHLLVPYIRTRMQYFVIQCLRIWGRWILEKKKNQPLGRLKGFPFATSYPPPFLLSEVTVAKLCLSTCRADLTSSYARVSPSRCGCPQAGLGPVCWTRSTVVSWFPRWQPDIYHILKCMVSPIFCILYCNIASPILCIMCNIT
jgi:hypothetical protein